MIGRLHLWRLLGALAVLAVLSLAPQAASAHAGHSHARAAAAIPHVAPVAQHAAAQIEQEAEQKNDQKVFTQELTETVPATPTADHGCGDRGCCSNGPCTGCHGFVIVPVPATVPPTLSSIVRLYDPPPHLGAGGTKLRRPPKSFV